MKRISIIVSASEMPAVRQAAFIAGADKLVITRIPHLTSIGELGNWHCGTSALRREDYTRMEITSCNDRHYLRRSFDRTCREDREYQSAWEIRILKAEQFSHAPRTQPQTARYATANDSDIFRNASCRDISPSTPSFQRQQPMHGPSPTSGMGRWWTTGDGNPGGRFWSRLRHDSI